MSDKGLLSLTVSQVNKLVEKTLVHPKLQEVNPPRIVLCGTVTKILNDESFVLFDGTSSIDVKFDTPTNVNLYEYVKIQAISTKMLPFKPIGLQKLLFGEQFMDHAINIMQGEGAQAANEFNDFIDNTATFM